MGRREGFLFLEFQGFDCQGFQHVIPPVLHVVGKWQKSVFLSSL